MFEEVSFDGGGDDGSVPFEEGGDGEPGGLAGAGGADDGDGVLGFGGDESPVDGAEGEPSGLGAADEERFEVSWFRPSGRVALGGVAVLPVPSPAGRDRGEDDDAEDGEDRVVGDRAGNECRGLGWPGVDRVVQGRLRVATG